MKHFLAILILSGSLYAETARERQLESTVESLSLSVSRLTEQLLDVRKDNALLRKQMAQTPAMRNRVQDLIQALQIDIPRAAQLSMESTRAQILKQTAEGFQRQITVLIFSDCAIMVLLGLGMVIVILKLSKRVDRDGIERDRLIRNDLGKAQSDAAEAQKVLTHLVSEIAQALQSRKQEQ